MGPLSSTLVFSFLLQKKLSLDFKRVKTYPFYSKKPNYLQMVIRSLESLYWKSPDIVEEHDPLFHFTRRGSSYLDPSLSSHFSTPHSSPNVQRHITFYNNLPTPAHIRLKYTLSSVKPTGPHTLLPGQSLEASLLCDRRETLTITVENVDRGFVVKSVFVTSHFFHSVISISDFTDFSKVDSFSAIPAEVSTGALLDDSPESLQEEPSDSSQEIALAGILELPI